MNTLVTGGGGFLGRYIVEQLSARGDAVRVFARGNYPEIQSLGAELIRGDIQDAQAVEAACVGIDTVFHVAAKAGFWGSWDSFYQPNVIGTRNIIAACQKQGVNKLIFTSSPSVVFNNLPQEGCDETIPYPEHYENFYSHTKAIAERQVIEANRDSLLTVSLRPHLIWGPRDTQILPRLIALASKGKIPQVGKGDNKVDLTYVEDAARAHLLAADTLQPGSPTAGSVYFISQDEPVNLWQFVNELLVRLNIPSVKRKISLPLARTAGGILEFSYKFFHLKGEPRLTRFLASELAMSHYYDISRARRDLGYQPQFTMSEAMEKTVAWLNQLT
ncbi:MAG: NAD-dependent epimerase/dehydratase family protein [Chloroflexota bacterium]